MLQPGQISEVGYNSYDGSTGGSWPSHVSDNTLASYMLNQDANASFPMYTSESTKVSGQWYGNENVSTHSDLRNASHSTSLAFVLNQGVETSVSNSTIGDQNIWRYEQIQGVDTTQHEITETPELPLPGTDDYQRLITTLKDLPSRLDTYKIKKVIQYLDNYQGDNRAILQEKRSNQEEFGLFYELENMSEQNNSSNFLEEINMIQHVIDALDNLSRASDQIIPEVEALLEHIETQIKVLNPSMDLDKFQEIQIGETEVGESLREQQESMRSNNDSESSIRIQRENIDTITEGMTEEYKDFLLQDIPMDTVIQQVGREEAKKYAIERGKAICRDQSSPSYKQTRLEYTVSDADVAKYKFKETSRRTEVRVEAGYGRGNRLDVYYGMTLDWSTKEVTIHKLFSAKDAQGAETGQTAISPDKILDNLLHKARTKVQEQAQRQKKSIDMDNFSIKNVKIDPLPSRSMDQDTSLTLDLFMKDGKRKLKQATFRQNDDGFYGLLGARISEEIYPFLQRNLDKNEIKNIKVEPGFVGPSLTFSSEDTSQ